MTACRPTLALGAMAVWLFVAPAQAQHHGGHRHGQSAPATPYAGMQSRDIKALSEAEQADLRAGRGMGLALAAELNGYAGPMHALEHADALGLDATQRARLIQLMDTMRAGGTASPEAVRAATAAVATAQGEVRAVHLVTHIAAREVLTPAQRDRYAALRGYRTPG